MALVNATLKYGWLKKQSRSGLFKNWKARYVVLENGIITYYEKKKNPHIPPYGENEKGIMHLRGATIADTPDAKQILIAGKSGEEKDLVLEADDPKTAAEWRNAIRDHIQSANLHFTGSNYSNNNIINQLDNSNHAPSQASDRNSLLDENSILPEPGFVIKTRRQASGEKIFINVCSHVEVPATVQSGMMGMGSSWPHMISSPGRLEKHGQKDDDAWVYDVVVNPSVIEIANDDNIATRDLVCKEAIKHIQKRYKDLLEKDFRLPLIQKRYVGEIRPVLLKEGTRINKLLQRLSLRKSRQMSSDNKSTVSKSDVKSDVDESDNLSQASGVVAPSPQSSPLKSSQAKKSLKSIDENAFTAAATTTALTPPPVTSLQVGGSNSSTKSAMTPTTPTAASAAAASTTTNTTTETLDSKPHTQVIPRRKSFTNPDINSPSSSSNNNNNNKKNYLPSNLPAKKIPYRITRPAGVVVRPTKDRKAQGRVLASGTQVGVFYREEADGLFWLKAKEGWIQENMGSNINEKSLVVSKYAGQPSEGMITTTTFHDPQGKNYQQQPNETVLLKAMFKIDILYPDGLIIKITRSFDEINTVQKALLKYGDAATIKKVKSINFYSDTEIDLDLMNDVSMLLQLIEVTGEWVSQVIQHVSVARCKCKQYMEFLEPTDDDVKAMELELMADGGLGGAWGNQL